MSAILGVVQPLAGVSTCCDIAVQVLDIDLAGGIHRLTWGTFLVHTEFEFSISMYHAVWGRVVDSVVLETKSVAIFSGESITFAWNDRWLVEDIRIQYDLQLLTRL